MSLCTSAVKQVAPFNKICKDPTDTFHTLKQEEVGVKVVIITAEHSSEVYVHTVSASFSVNILYL